MAAASLPVVAGVLAILRDRRIRRSVSQRERRAIRAEFTTRLRALELTVEARDAALETCEHKLAECTEALTACHLYMGMAGQ